MGMKVFVVDMMGWSTARLLTTAARLNENRQNEGLRLSGLTHSGLVSLRVLRDKGALPQVELAGLVRVQTQTIGKVLERLELRGFVERTRSDTDRRLQHAAITSAGRKALKEVERRDADASQTEGLSTPALRAALINIVRSASTGLRIDDAV